MAFTTEFVMGTGGAVEVEEIPVSMSGGGGSSSAPTVYPLTTVNAGTGAWVWVDGTLAVSTTQVSVLPQLQVGNRVYTLGQDRAGGGGYFTGTVNVAVLSRSFASTTFTGKVYVTRM